MIHNRILYAVAFVLCMTAAGRAVGDGGAAANESLRISTDSVVAPAPESKPEPPTAATQPAAADAAAGEGAKLPPPSPREESKLADAPPASGPAGWWSTLAALAVVLALVFALRWLVQRSGRGGAQAGATGAMEILGRQAVSSRQSVLLLRVGAKVLVVGVGGEAMRTLAEIDDPAEVSELLGAAQRAKAGSLTDSFARALRGRQGQFDAGAADEDASPAGGATSAGGAAEQMRNLIDRVRGLGPSGGRRP